MMKVDMATACSGVMVLIVVCSWSAGEQLQNDKSSDQPKQKICTPTKTALPDGTLVSIAADCSVSAVNKPELLDRAKVPAPSTSGNSALQNSTSSDLSGADRILPAAPLPTLVSKDVQQKYAEALNAYYAYHIEGFQHRQRVFRWQLFSSKIIFVAVLMLVVAGIYFAALQFHAGLKRQAMKQVSALKEMAAKAGDDEQTSAVGDQAGEGITTFSASLRGIKVSSPVLGVVILTISLAFFYLYLVYVYPIHDTF